MIAHSPPSRHALDIVGLVASEVLFVSLALRASFRSRFDTLPRDGGSEISQGLPYHI